MKKRVLICDDNNNDIEIIKKDLLNYDLDIECLSNIENINNSYDIVIMDIELNQDKNGIDYVKEKFSNCEVIYITGYYEYCTKVYETNHIYFLLKPYNKNDLDKAINKAINNVDKKNKTILNIKNRTEKIKIIVDDIYYIESNKRKIIITTNNEKYETYSSLKSIKNYLPNYFILCHNSFIVNIRRVKSITKNSFILDNNLEVFISQKKYKESKEKFLSFIGGHYE